jgi:hypothetical protein
MRKASDCGIIFTAGFRFHSWFLTSKFNIMILARDFWDHASVDSFWRVSFGDVLAEETHRLEFF